MDSDKSKQSMEIAEDARQQEREHPSFAGEMFMGRFLPELVFPFPEQPEKERQEGDAFIEQLMDYLRKNLDPDLVDVTRTIPAHVIQEMGRLGVFALKIPKEYGGLGFSQTNYNRLVMRVSSYCGATAVLISAHQSIGVPQPLLMYGTEEQKKKFLPLFREGKISAFALTETDVGSDPARMSAEARLSDDGTHYILNGSKLWCTNGVIADIIVVMAKTKPKIVNGKEKTQISAFILDMKTPGIEVVHRCEFMGLGGIYNGLIRFTDVKIPRENLLWDEGRGLALALGTINIGRLTLPAACAGAAKQCLSIARRWGAERVQWGLPIGLHESGREKLAFIASTTFAMEAVCWLTSYWADSKDRDIRIEAAMAKMFTTEALWKIVDMTMQLRGGRGYEKALSLKARGEEPFPVERAMRDCRVNMILEGSTEIMKLFLAREAIDPHFKLAKPLMTSKSSFGEKTKAIFEMFKFYSIWYPKQKLHWFTGRRFPQLGKLDKYYRSIERYSHRLSSELFIAMVKYREKLEHKQLLLGRLMDIGTDLFTMAAACSYSVHLDKDKSKEESPIELADYYCQLAQRRIEANFKALWNNDDKATDKIGKEVVEKKFRWLEEGIEWSGNSEQ